MRNYILRRLLLMIPSIFLVAVFTFTLVRLIPGDALMAQILSTGMMGDVNEERKAEFMKELGLTGSLPEQFGKWGWDALHLNFGKSFLTKEDTLQRFVGRVGVTVQLGLMAITFTVLIGVAIGVLSAIRQDGLVDYVGRFIAIVGLAIPNFWLGLMIVVFSARWFHHAFPTGIIPLFSRPAANLQQFIVPALVMAVGGSAVAMRMTRTTMLDVLRQDYMRTAHAKGLAERVVIVRHALKNALIPVITMIGAQLATIVGGSVIIEQLFNLQGVGQLTFTSISQRDYPQVQTNILIFSTVLVVGNLITDLTYGWLDPRIRYS